MSKVKYHSSLYTQFVGTPSYWDVVDILCGVPIYSVPDARGRVPIWISLCEVSQYRTFAVQVPAWRRFQVYIYIYTHLWPLSRTRMGAGFRGQTVYASGDKMFLGTSPESWTRTCILCIYYTLYVYNFLTSFAFGCGYCPLVTHQVHEKNTYDFFQRPCLTKTINFVLIVYILIVSYLWW